MSGEARARDLVVALGERWWQAMLQGRKRFEVRRRWVRERAEGQRCWVYSGGRVAGWFIAGPAIAMVVSDVAELEGTAMTPEDVENYAHGLRGGELTVIGVEECRLFPRADEDSDWRLAVPGRRMRELGFAIPRNVRYADPAEREIYECAELGILAW